MNIVTGYNLIRLPTYYKTQYHPDRQWKRQHGCSSKLMWKITKGDGDINRRMSKL
jgi:hypothetical protein